MHRISTTPLLLLPNKDHNHQLKSPRKDNKQRGSCPFFLLFSLSLSVTQVTERRNSSLVIPRLASLKSQFTDFHSNCNIIGSSSISWCLLLHLMGMLMMICWQMNRLSVAQEKCNSLPDLFLSFFPSFNFYLFLSLALFINN